MWFFDKEKDTTYDNIGVFRAPTRNKFSVEFWRLTSVNNKNLRNSPFCRSNKQSSHNNLCRCTVRTHHCDVILIHIIIASFGHIIIV